jgi:hypothetical protein
MNFANLFSFGSSGTSDELPDIFPMPVLKEDFVEVDVLNIYSKILTDVIERSQGLSDKYQQTLWDNCLASEVSAGLISRIAKAMAKKTDLFIVFDKSTNVLRSATSDEERIIREDYKNSGESAAGTYVSFKNYQKTDMVKLYSALEYCAISSLYKNMNLSTAVQFKMNEMRGSTGLADSANVITQAKAMATGLSNGKNILMDGKDIIETAKPELEPTEKAMAFINERRSFYLGLPASYITGVQTKTMGDTGNADAKAVERGLKNYFFSIIKPVVESIYGAKLTFKSEDYHQIESALNTLKTFELTSEEFLAAENKIIIINRLFGLPDDEKGGPAEKPVVVDPNAPKPTPGAPTPPAPVK